MPFAKYSKKNTKAGYLSYKATASLVKFETNAFLVLNHYTVLSSSNTL